MKTTRNERRMVSTNLSFVLVLLLLGFFVVLGTVQPSDAKVSQNPADLKSGLPATADMDTLTAIFTRRSIRQYTNQPVSDATIKILLQAGMAAPSAKNTQSWEFVVIRDKKTLAQIPAFHPFAKHIPSAQAAIVVCGNTKLQAAPGHWIPDASNASMSILLAAHSLGLGAVWTTFYPYEDRTAGIRKLLNLPEHIMPLNIIPLGYPVEKGKYQDRFKPAKIHNEKW